MGSRLAPLGSGQNEQFVDGRIDVSSAQPRTKLARNTDGRFARAQEGAEREKTGRDDVGSSQLSGIQREAASLADVYWATEGPLGDRVRGANSIDNVSSALLIRSSLPR